MNSNKNSLEHKIITFVGNKIFHFCTSALRLSVSAIARCLTIKKNTIVFASFPDFTDNSWAMYKYLKENRHDLKLFWLMQGDSKPKEVSDNEILKIDIRSYIFYLWIISRAGFIMSTHGFRGDKFNRKRKINIYLSHGGCPIKGEKRELRTFTSSKRSWDFALCRGRDGILPSSKWLCCDPKLVLPLGMARDDIFCKNIGLGYKNPFYNGHSSKLIVWMPTFRKSVKPELSENNSATTTGLPLMQSEEDVYALDSFLKSTDIQLLIKIHPLQEDNPLFKKHFSNITIVTNTILNSINKQTYEVIGYSDALITDYSSVYFDYLITDKPVGFILDDYDEYEKDRGFVFDNPKKIMAGHHIYNVDELKNFFIDILESNDQYIQLRQLIRERFVGEHPELTCKRIVEYFNI